jgi:hypothetical protein
MDGKGPAPLGPAPTEAALHTLWFHRSVARRAVKVAAILGLDNLKAFGNAVDLYIPR